jgi:hypothetical protein
VWISDTTTKFSFILGVKLTFHNISCGITIETAFIQKNRVENTILAKLLQRAGPVTLYDENMSPLKQILG